MGLLHSAKQAKILMIIIRKIIARHEASHRDNRDNEIYVLFEKAKQVFRSEDLDSLAEATKDL